MLTVNTVKLNFKIFVVVHAITALLQLFITMFINFKPIIKFRKFELHNYG